MFGNPHSIGRKHRKSLEETVLNAEVKANKVLSMAIGGAFHAGVEVPQWVVESDYDVKLLAHVPTWTLNSICV